MIQAAKEIYGAMSVHLQRELLLAGRLPQNYRKPMSAGEREHKAVKEMNQGTHSWSMKSQMEIRGDRNEEAGRSGSY